MIKAVVIDDEKDARFLLRDLVEKHCAGVLQLVGEADGIKTGIKCINEVTPDVVFLDIKMHEGTGFDLLEKIKKPSFEVVFITAYDSFAIQAFRFSAFGYLLKPIKLNELKSVIEKLAEHFAHLRQKEDPRMKILVENYGDDKKIKKLVVTNLEGFQVLNVEEIIRLEGDKNYTHFVSSGKTRKITSSKTLGEYEELLNNHGFFRVHQSTIINLRHVKGFDKGNEEIEMVDNVRVKISRYRKAAFLKRFI
ncbi:MAG TPA: LytTR family DNA-binding domain-containing protein [Flavobacteriales bacterium]|nr:LytTR family DNA-binding domain-containing protein [Flavobacteriales bacterium]